MVKNLYAVLLGGKLRENHLMEDHHLVFVVANSEKEARVKAKRKWQASEIHVDGTQLIKKVDGFIINLEEDGSQGSSFKINPNYS